MDNKYHRYLDEILQYIINKEDNPGYIDDIPKVQYIRNQEIDKCYEMAIEKLIRDEYIIEISDVGEPMYKTTIEGRMLNESGGYSEQLRKNKTIKIRDTIEKWAIILAGLTATIYYVFEICKILHNHVRLC